MFNRNILIADDDISLLKLFTSIFKPVEVRNDHQTGLIEEEEFKVKTFEDGKYLWEYFKSLYDNKEKIPLCILDLKMPVVDGLKTAEELRKIDHDVMIIIVTAHSDVTSEAIRSNLKENIYYIRKPFNHDELYCLVDSLIKGWNKNQKLKEREEKYRSIFETLQDIYYCMDMNGTITEISPSVSVLGYYPYELIGYPITYIYLTPDEHKTFLKKLEDRSFISDYELKLKKKDGSFIYVSLNAHFVYDREGKNPLYIEGVYRDITDRKRVEQELEDYRTRLEEIVVQRTNDLSLSNDLLREGIEELKKTKEDLRKSEERYKLITNTITDYIYTVRLQDGTPVETIHSPSCIAVTGYTSEDFFRNPYLWIQMVYEEDRTMVKDYADAILSSRKVRPVEHRIRRKDGTIRWVRNTPVFYYSNTRKLLAYDGLVQDITERKNAEEILQEQEERFRELFYNLRSGVAIYAPLEEGNDFILKDINRAGEKIDKIKKDSVVGKRLSEIFPEKEKRKIFEVIEKVWKTGKSDYYPLSLYNNDLLVEFRENYIYRLPSGEIVMVYDDVTKRKQLEETLHYRLAIEELVTTISTCFINLSHDVVDREIKRALQSIGEFAGVDRSFIINLSSEEPVKIENIYEWYAQGLEARKKQFIDTPVEPFLDSLKKLGQSEHLYIPGVKDLPPEKRKEKEFWENLEVRSILAIPMVLEENLFGVFGFTLERIEKDWKDEDVRLLRLVGEIFVNVLERKRAEEEKKVMENKLLHSQKLKAIGTLAGGIAHNFNNILASIMGYTELSLLDVSEGTELHFHLNKILESCNRAKEQVKQILAFSRPGVYELKPVKIDSIVRETLKLIKASISVTIEVREDIKEYGGTVIADAGQIRQVVINLCTNASQAMPGGGIMEISLTETAVTSKDTFLWGSLKPGNYLKFTVRDTGRGMNKEILERIFEPYFTTRTMGEATGMGLPVVHGIIKNHGGDILVESTPGKGSVFHVFLPVNDEFESESSNDLRRKKKKILFVDDEEDLAYIVEMRLKRLGYDVVSTSSSREGLKLFQRDPFRFDLVITDQTMPRLTGCGLAWEIHAIRPDLPVVLCTGYSDLVERDEALKAGITEFIMKPFDIQDMAETIRKVMESG